MPSFNLSYPTTRRELRAGLTTFMTMAYIVVVNPLILADAGMPKEAVMAATCLAAALGSFLMGWLTNYPFALAPGMGLNAFFTYTIVLGMGLSWQAALGAVFISGILFFLLTISGIRQALITSIPMNLKYAISVGIGLFIALIGLKNAGLIVFHPSTGSLGLIDSTYFNNAERLALLPAGTSPHSIGLALVGLAFTAMLVVRGIKGAFLWGILATWLAGIPLGVSALPATGSIIGLPRGLGDTFLALDIPAALDYGLLTIILTFTFVDLFDSLGTLIGISHKANLLDAKGRLPKARGAFLADSIATIGGALLGTSTTTTYIESASGIAAGGRTGLTAFTTGSCFLLALFFAPLVSSIPAVATTPVLVLVGVFMMEPVTRINFSDYLEAIPAFLTIFIMPFAFSIAAGISAGIVAYTFLHIVVGRLQNIGWMLWILSFLFIIRYII